MKVSWFRSGLLLGFFAAAVPVKAREPIPATLEAPSPGFLSGERIRLRLPSGVRYSGRVVSADDSFVTVAGRDGLVLKVDRRELSGVEVSQARGRGEGALRGSLKGAALGALLGGFVYAVDQGSKRPDGLCGDLSTGITRCTTLARRPARSAAVRQPLARRGSDPRRRFSRPATRRPESACP